LYFVVILGFSESSLRDSEGRIRYLFAAYAQKRLNNYYPGSTVTSQTFNYNVVATNAVYVNWWRGIIERFD